MIAFHRRRQHLARLLACLWATTTFAAPLKLWHAYRGAEEDALKTAVARFSLEFKIDVELLAVPYDTLSSKLTTSIPHGVGPDVFIFAHERLSLFHRMTMVSPSTEHIDTSRYLSTGIEALRIDGQTYGYPLSLKALALFVNTNRVQSPTSTTDELFPVLKSLSNRETQTFGLAYEAGDFYFHAPFLFGFGGQLFSAEGRAQFDTPALTESLRFVRGLSDLGFIPEEPSGALVKALFNEGRAAMVISGPWFVGEIDSSIDYEIRPLPVVSSTHKAMTPFLGVEAAFVSSRSENQSMAQMLARSLSLGQSAVDFAKVGRQIPADRLAYDIAEISDDRQLATFRKIAEQSVPTPNTLEMGRVWEPMKLALRAVLQGGVKPEEAGQLAERRYRALHRTAPPQSNVAPWILASALAALSAVMYGFALWRKTGATALTKSMLGRALVYMAPAATGVLVLITLPLAVGIGLSFFHHENGEYTFVGLANFGEILSSKNYAIDEPLSFYFTLVVTVTWTLVNVALHVAIGLTLAIALKSPLLKLKSFFRVLLIVPWAIPNYITALMWKGMFHRQFGAINAILTELGIAPVSWFAHFSTAFSANVIANTWLGFPFMMVVALGALQSIPSELYEAAEVDGASPFRQFRAITLPLLRPAMRPAIILGSVWTFNMFNIIYLISGGEPGGATDILVSEAYRWAFQRNEQYGFAAAYSVVIFGVLFAWSAMVRRFSGEAVDER